MVFNINPAGGGGGMNAEALEAMHVWKETTTEVTPKISTTLEYVEIVRSTSASATGMAHYSDSISLDSNGNVVLDNPSTVSVTYNTYTNANVLRGKYWQKDGVPAVWFTPTSSSAAQWVDTDDYSYRDVVVRMQSYRVMTESVEYYSSAFSEDENAYPQDDTVDGIHYRYLDTFNNVIASAAKIETGSYTGTGSYGLSNPNSLTFSFEPSIVFVQGKGVGGDASEMIPLVLLRGSTISGQTFMNSIKQITVAWNGASVSWYLSENNNSTFLYPVEQYNYSGRTYNYIAIG